MSFFGRSRGVGKEKETQSEKISRKAFQTNYCTLKLKLVQRVFRHLKFQQTTGSAQRYGLRFSRRFNHAN